jgi:type II secretory pathway predicted ATPase ExeA/septal ring-binding cell division protein DamX
MYYEHFGLTQAPFKITPNTDFFFTGGNRGPVLEALLYAITRGEGIVKVTGEVGSGKTMLCNMLQDRLPDLVESVYLANPSVGPEEVLQAIAFELQLGLDRNADRLEVMHALQDYLVKRHAEGMRVVVFIEESQSMPLATLEEIRLLSNLETRSDKLLQIVMFGQPELDENLRRPEIRQLRDRIAHSFRLQPLTDEEVREYLMFRMRAAGYRGPDIFSSGVVRQIAKASSGLTRRVNLIADKALLAAFSEDTHTIRPRHVQAALRDSEFGHAMWPSRFSPALGWGALALLVGTAVGAGLHAYFEPLRRGEAPTAVAASPAPVTDAPAPAAAAGPTATPPGSSATSPEPTESAAASAGVARNETAPTAIEATVETPRTPESAKPTIPPPPATVRDPAPEATPAPSTEAVSVITQPPDRLAAQPTRGDVIATRMEATAHWAQQSETRDRHSIQLLVAPGEDQLRKHLKVLLKFIELNDIYMYRSVGRDSAKVNVLYGSFASRERALDELYDLPAALQVNRPYVRPVSAVRAEIELQRRSSRE